jgi:hypothetical protein
VYKSKTTAALKFGPFLLIALQIFTPTNFLGSAKGGPKRSKASATATAPLITMQPSSTTVTVGQTATFSVTSTGTAPILYQWQKNGIAISSATSSTYTTPLTGMSDNGSEFSVVVSNGIGTVVSNSATLTVNGIYILSASPLSLSFGTVSVSTSVQQSVTLTNSGAANITVSNVSVSGAGFNASGLSTGMTLAPGQSASLIATFMPATTGDLSGSITIASNVTNGPTVIKLAGTGVSATHSVALSWTPSSSSVVGYNVYSSAVSGGPYAKLTSGPIEATAYTDSGLQMAQTRYYVVTAVDSMNNESTFSSEASAIIP